MTDTVREVINDERFVKMILEPIDTLQKAMIDLYKIIQVIDMRLKILESAQND